jgi:hypothetical protein
LDHGQHEVGGIAEKRITRARCESTDQCDRCPKQKYLRAALSASSHSRRRHGFQRDLARFVRVHRA